MATHEKALDHAPGTIDVGFEEVRDLLASGRSLLINAMPPAALSDGIIAGSINVPASDMDERLYDRIPNRAQAITVYCKDSD